MNQKIFFNFFQISLRQFSVIFSVLIDLKLFFYKYRYKFSEISPEIEFFQKKKSLKFFGKFKNEFKKKITKKKNVKLFSRDKFKIKIQKILSALVFSLPLDIISDSDFLYTSRFCFFKNLNKEVESFVGHNLFWYSQLRIELEKKSRILTEKNPNDHKLGIKIQKKQKILNREIFLKLRENFFYENLEKIQKKTNQNYYYNELFDSQKQSQVTKNKKFNGKGSFESQTKLSQKNFEKVLKSFVCLFFKNSNKKNYPLVIKPFESKSNQFLHKSNLEGHWLLGEFVIFEIINITNFFLKSLIDLFVNEILYFTNLFFKIFSSKLYKISRFFSPLEKFNKDRFSFCFLFAILENYQKTYQKFSEKKFALVFVDDFLKKTSEFFKQNSVPGFLFAFWKPFFLNNFNGNDILCSIKFKKEKENKLKVIKNCQNFTFNWDFKMNLKYIFSRTKNKLGRFKSFFHTRMLCLDLNKKSQKNLPQKKFLYFLKNLFLLKKLNLGSRDFLSNPLILKKFLFFFIFKKKKKAVVKILSFLLDDSFFFEKVFILQNQKIYPHLKRLGKRKTLSFFKNDIALSFVQNLLRKSQKLETKIDLISVLIDKIKISSKPRKNERGGLFYLHNVSFFLKMKFIFYQSRDFFSPKKKNNPDFRSLEKFKEYQFTTIISSFLEIKNLKEQNKLFIKNPDFIFPFLKKLNGIVLSHSDKRGENLFKKIKKYISNYIFFQINGFGFFSKNRIFIRGRNFRKISKQIKIFSFLQRSLFLRWLIGENSINWTKKNLSRIIKKRKFSETSLTIFW